MNKYYRITGYCPENDFSFIMDSNGMFEKLWEFSAFLVAKGLNIIKASRLENIIDININQVEEDKEHIILRANADGKPEYVNHTIDGITYQAIKVADKLYIVNN